MGFSGTVSTTVFDTDKLLTSAFRRCKLHASQLTSETWDIARNELFLLLSEMANEKIPLWCITKILMPFYEGTPDVTLPLGVVDVLNSNFRSTQRQTGTQTVTNTSYTTHFASDTAITTVGMLWSSSSVPVSFQRSEDGVNWETIQSETPQAVTGEWTWYDLQSSVAKAYFRVVATSYNIFLSDLYLGNNPTETPLARMNRDDYTNLPNKYVTSDRPLQYWFDRTVRYPIMHVWPAPNAAATTSQIVAWVHRHIMDVGDLTDEIEVPQRWYKTITTSLAVELARNIPEVDAALLPDLIAARDEVKAPTSAEERDRSPTKWAPNIAMYTR